KQLCLYFLDEGCAKLTYGDQSFDGPVVYSPMNWFETPAVVKLESACSGEEALGLESGLITDQQITASSSWDAAHGQQNARLNHQAARGKTSAWSAQSNDLNQWLQIDFGRNVKITKLATQGRNDYGDQRVKSYTLDYSAEGSNVFQAYQENESDKVFNGNADQNTVVTHVLLQPITARYVQIKPKSWNEHISMRAEFYGCVLSDRYQVLGRNVHMDYVQEHLRTKREVTFGETQERANRIELEILTDTVYVKGHVDLRGIKRLTILSRKVIFSKDSRLDLRAPNLVQNFNNLSPGSDGDDGEHGVHGPTVTVYAKMIAGYVNIITSGGNGKPGQNGANGRKAADSMHKQPDRTNSDCKAGKTWNGCTSHFAGRPGISGGNGGNGGDGGRSGNGGHAGHQTLHALTVKGKIELTSCRGTGGQPAINGLGGAGGLGGRGGRGINCRKKERCGGFKIYTCSHWCESSGQTGEAARGATGRSGSNGKELVAKGSNGQVESSYLQKFSLGPEQLKKYPLQLIKMMTRYGEELLWANDVKKSDAVFKFVVNLSNGNPEASELRKVAKRRLAFMNKVGYDRFGKNQLFAPIIKWEALKKQVEVIKDRAETFEKAYNAIKESIKRQDDVKTIVKALPRTTRLQVVKQKNRLEEARRVAVSEKGAYVLAIGELEASMKSNLLEAKAMLPDVYEKAKFNSDDLFVILEGITGFFSGAMGKDPFAALGSALGVIGHFAGKCDLGKLQGNLDKVEKWLKFGKDYAALKDSSELDFDKMDVAAVPEVMQANLEMNKEGLAADLVCLLDERSKPRNSAKFQEQIERFFIAGAARIDLIAKVMDLDNEIGGHNFDILNLEETANEIESLRSSGDSPIAESTQQMFLDGLLTSYQHIETGFAQQLYQLYKGFEFRSLWVVQEKLAEFERRAVLAAQGTGNLKGVLELTKALQEIDNIENKGQRCFTKFRHTVTTHKWTFDSAKDNVMFDELQKGTTRFSLKISDSCDLCYNIRLLKMYVELEGDKSQSGDYPSSVYLKLRHLSGSYFRDGNGNVREFRQPLGSWRTLEFDRFAITNTKGCNKEKAKGNKDSLFCMGKDDNRFQPMCCHYLSGSPCDDTLLGAEECRSPFGTYEMTMPIDSKTPCTASGSRITHENCKEFDRSVFTKMNVWIQYLYWTGEYPTGPDDLRCSKFQDPDSEAEHVPITFNHEASGDIES
ncbi:unnamed protein product, partial [Pocillopora meandrina]